MIKKMLFVLLFLQITLLICASGQSEDSQYDPMKDIATGFAYYDQDNYEKALPLLAKAAQAGIEDGILFYRIAYSYEQLNGLSQELKDFYVYTLKLLSSQYPDHIYYSYALNKTKTFVTSLPHRAENGDLYNWDNDGDGRREPVYVRGYFRKDGTYVRGHYRARPR